MKKSIVSIIFAASIFVSFSYAFAHKAIDIGFDRKSEDSDVVLIGTVKEIDCPGPVSKLGKNYVQSCATVLPSVLLKGIEKLSYVVMCGGGVAELAHDSCKLGGKYLLFLKAAEDETFYVTNGKYGAYIIK